MIRATVLLCLSLALCVGFAASPANAGAHPRMMLGPGDAHVHGIKDEALIRMSKFGPIYIAGQQNSHLTITHVERLNSLRFRDTNTQRLNKLPDRCHRERVKKGISAVCKIPPRFRHRAMFVQVWPRLGNDFVDGRTLPHRFRMWVLADAGRDVVHCGKGNDFVNGAKGDDYMWGGAGNDFLRKGPGRDHVWGGPGKDRIGRG